MEELRAFLPPSRTILAAGEYTSFAANSRGELYGWGYNGEVRRLGIPPTGVIPVPTRIHVPHPVMAIATNFPTLLLTVNGELYGVGNNMHGELGLPLPHYGKFTLIPFSQPLVAAAAGEEHILVLTQTGEVYASGDNEYGQLGVSHTRQALSLTPIPDLRATAIAADRYASAAITLEGQLYAWGLNEVEHLAIGVRSSNQPRLVDLPEPVISVSLGNSQAIVVGESGTVYICGLGEYGQLGLGNKEQQLTFVPNLLIPEPVVLALTNQAAGMGVVTENGRLYAFGLNINGQLGLGRREIKQLSPERVALSAPVSTVSLGMYHLLLATVEDRIYASGFRGNGVIGDGISGPMSQYELVELSLT